MMETVPGTVSETTAARLVESHRQFLAFLERRVGSRAAAEDILQDAFVRGLRRADTLRSEESAVAWFYRLLRNAIADHFRRRRREERARILASVGADQVALATGTPYALPLRRAFARRARRIHRG